MRTIYTIVFTNLTTRQARRDAPVLVGSCTRTVPRKFNRATALKGNSNPHLPYRIESMSQRFKNRARSVGERRRQSHGTPRRAASGELCDHRATRALTLPSWTRDFRGNLQRPITAEIDTWGICARRVGKLSVGIGNLNCAASLA